MALSKASEDNTEKVTPKSPKMYSALNFFQVKWKDKSLQHSVELLHAHSSRVNVLSHT